MLYNENKCLSSWQHPGRARDWRVLYVSLSKFVQIDGKNDSMIMSDDKTCCLPFAPRSVSQPNANWTKDGMDSRVGYVTPVLGKCGSRSYAHRACIISMAAAAGTPSRADRQAVVRNGLWTGCTSGCGTGRARRNAPHDRVHPGSWDLRRHGHCAAIASSSHRNHRHRDRRSDADAAHVRSRSPESGREWCVRNDEPFIEPSTNA